MKMSGTVKIMRKTGSKPLDDMQKGKNPPKMKESQSTSRRRPGNFFSSGDGYLIGSSTSVKLKEEELCNIKNINYRILERETADNINYDTFSFFEKYSKRKYRLQKYKSNLVNQLTSQPKEKETSCLETIQLNSLQYQSSIKQPLGEYNDNVQSVSKSDTSESTKTKPIETKHPNPAMLIKSPELNYYDSKEYKSEQKALNQIIKMREKMFKKYEENKQKELEEEMRTANQELDQGAKKLPISTKNEKAVSPTKRTKDKLTKKATNSESKNEDDENTTDDNESKSQSKNSEGVGIKLVGASEQLIGEDGNQMNPTVENKVIDNDYFEEKLAKLRYVRSIKPDPFQKKIMSTEIFNYFRKNPSEFPSVPEHFEDYNSYRDHWLPLFEYECYSQLINLRKEGAKCRIANMGWSAKLQFTHCDSRFVYFKMEEPVVDKFQFDCKNHCGFQIVDNEKSKNFGSHDRMNWLNMIDSLRENDLIVASQQRLTGIYDLFDLSSEDKADRFFNQMLPKNGKFIAIVDRRRRLKDTCISLKTDNMHKDDLKKLLCPETKVIPIFFCYFLTSISTVLREYKALHAIEYSPYLSKVLNPCKSLEDDINNSLSLDYENWQHFINTNGKHFNESQLSALKRVTEMKKQEILLIQGPPGTGKTQTIHGMISMILCRQTNPDQKIFVCAPSNAAVDEIVCRLVNKGLISYSGKKKKAELVRIGVLDYNPPDLVRQHSMDYLIEEKMKKSSFQQDNRTMDDYQRRINRIELIKEHIASSHRLGIPYQEFLDKHKKEMEKLYKIMKTQMRDEFTTTTLHDRRIDLLNQLQTSYRKAVNSIRNNQVTPATRRMKIEKDIINEAKIICTTLSMSGIEKLEKLDLSFSHLIVDEACQSTEISTLIPFTHNPERIILVGDQNQLPATCFASNSLETNYSKSFYERLLNQNTPQIMLTIQYRMHPEIREFPSEQFYDGKITDNPCVIGRSSGRLSKHAHRLMFYDLLYASENGGYDFIEESNSKSKSNRDEADFIIKLLAKMIEILASGDGIHSGLDRVVDKIGIITPYKKQTRLIKEVINRELPRALNIDDRSFIPEKVAEVNTVDSFQGREKEVIIISCVRAGGEGSTIGFLNDFRRMNVAISRAKSHLWIVGHSKTLNQNHNWKALISHCKSHKRFTQYISRSDVEKVPCFSKTKEEYLNERSEEKKLLAQYEDNDEDKQSNSPVKRSKSKEKNSSKKRKKISENEEVDVNEPKAEVEAEAEAEENHASDEERKRDHKSSDKNDNSS